MTLMDEAIAAHTTQMKATTRLNQMCSKNPRPIWKIQPRSAQQGIFCVVDGGGGGVTSWPCLKFGVFYFNQLSTRG